MKLMAEESVEMKLHFLSLKCSILSLRFMNQIITETTHRYVWYVLTRKAKKLLISLAVIIKIPYN